MFKVFNHSMRQGKRHWNHDLQVCFITKQPSHNMWSCKPGQLLPSNLFPINRGSICKPRHEFTSPQNPLYSQKPKLSTKPPFLSFEVQIFESLKPCNFCPNKSSKHIIYIMYKWSKHLFFHCNSIINIHHFKNSSLQLDLDRMIQTLSRQIESCNILTKFPES